MKLFWILYQKICQSPGDRPTISLSKSIEFLGLYCLPSALIVAYLPFIYNIVLNCNCLPGFPLQRIMKVLTICYLPLYPQIKDRLWLITCTQKNRGQMNDQQKPEKKTPGLLYFFLILLFLLVMMTQRMNHSRLVKYSIADKHMNAMYSV